MNNKSDFLDIIDLSTNEDDKGKRIDKYISDMLYSYSRSYIQKLIDEELVLVNDKLVKSNYKICAGDEIVVKIPVPEELKIEAEDIPLDIVYEDEDVILINKPKGMVVHLLRRFRWWLDCLADSLRMADDSDDRQFLLETDERPQEGDP